MLWLNDSNVMARTGNGQLANVVVWLENAQSVRPTSVFYNFKQTNSVAALDSHNYPSWKHPYCKNCVHRRQQDG